MALAKIKLANFGHFLVEELKSGGSCAKDLIIRCKDGDVLLHKVLVASLSTSLFKILKQNSEDEVIQVILPDASKFHASMLVQILYTGEASGIKKEDVDEIKSLANLLKFKSASFSLSVNTEESKSVSYRMDLQIEMIERKRKEKPSVVIPNVDDVETKANNFHNTLIQKLNLFFQEYCMVESVLLVSKFTSDNKQSLLFMG